MIGAKLSMTARMVKLEELAMVVVVMTRKTKTKKMMRKKMKMEMMRRKTKIGSIQASSGRHTCLLVCSGDKQCTKKVPPWSKRGTSGGMEHTPVVTSTGG